MNKQKNSIGRSAAILTASKIITMFIALVSGMLLSRFRTLEEYGTYSQIQIVVSLAVTFFLLGLPNSMNYFLARYDTHEERKHFLSVYYTFCTILCFVMGIVLALSVPIIVRFFKNELIKNFVYILVLLPWTQAIMNSISNVLVVYGKAKKLALFNGLHAGVSLISVLITKIGGWTFREYMLLYMLGELALMFWVYMIVWKLEGSISLVVDNVLLRAILHYSIPIGLATLVGTIMNDTDKLIIGQLLNTEKLAIYTNAARELPFTVITASLTSVLLPQMAYLLKDKDEYNTEQAISLWGYTVELSYIFMAFVVTTLIVFAPQIMTILYSQKYMAGVNVFRCYAIVLLVRITSFGMISNATGHTRYVFYITVISMFLNIALDFLFFYIFGFVGPAIATAFTHLVSAIIYLIVSSNIVQITIRGLFPWKKLLKHSLINLGWGIVVYNILKILHVGVSSKEITCCICGGVFIVAFYYLIEKKTIRKLWKLIS